MKAPTRHLTTVVIVLVLLAIGAGVFACRRVLAPLARAGLAGGQAR